MMQGLILIGLSLFGVLIIYAVSRIMGFGQEARIADEIQAKRIAGESHYGFDAVDAVVDRGGFGALVKDAANRHILIRAQGSHFVARMITPPIEGQLDQHNLTLAVAEPSFGTVTLNLGPKAQFWAAGLRHIPRG